MLVDELVAHFTPLLDEKGFELCEVTFESQKGEKTLHFAIDKKEGIMDLEATVQLSEFISEELDRLNFSDDSYTLDVSSPGAERPIPLHQMERFVHKYVHLHLTHPIEGENILEGTLEEVNNDTIMLSYQIKTRTKTLSIPRKDIDKARLAIKF